MNRAPFIVEQRYSMVRAMGASSPQPSPPSTMGEREKMLFASGATKMSPLTGFQIFESDLPKIVGRL